MVVIEMQVRWFVKGRYIFYEIVTLILLIFFNLFNHHKWNYIIIIPLTFFIISINILLTMRFKDQLKITKIKAYINFILVCSLIWYLGGINNISYHVFCPFAIITATAYISRFHGGVLFVFSNILYTFLFLYKSKYINAYLIFIYITIAAVVIGNFLRYYIQKSNDLDKKVKEFEALYKISKLIDSFPSTQIVLDGITEIVAKTLGIDDCIIMLYDEEKDILSSKASYGSIHLEPQNIIFAKGEGVTGKVLQTLESVVSSDLVRDHHIIEAFKYHVAARACAIIPLVFNNQGIGVIAVFEKDRYEFTKDTIELLDIIASRIGRVLENDKLYKEVKMDSCTDGLTKLYNYRYFYKVLKEEIQRAKEYNTKLFLLIIDVDKFKHFNDRYSHIVGDKVLREISRVIKDSIRRSDIAARYGGEEFAIILPKSEISTARKVAERIKEKIKKVNNNITDIKDEDVEITVSIGISSYPYCAKGMMNLIKEADMRMYYGKESGGDTVVYMENNEIC